MSIKLTIYLVISLVWWAVLIAGAFKYGLIFSAPYLIISFIIGWLVDRVVELVRRHKAGEVF